VSEPQQPQTPEPAEYIDRWQVAVLESKLFVVEQEAKKSIRDLLRQNEELQNHLQAARSELERYHRIETQTVDGLTTQNIIRDLRREIAELKLTLNRQNFRTAENEELQIYKLAMESMAKQFIHPRMTALELAELQLKGQTPPCKSTSTTAN